MRAVLYSQYGTPGVLQLKEIEKPSPMENEVLIKVYATTVTATDCVFRKGEPKMTRLYTGLMRPKNTILGTEFAGEIEALGSAVTSFRKGDSVFGTLPGHGAYAEYISVPVATTTLAIKPVNKTYEETIACCDGFLTALPFLRNKGNIRNGQTVLINGASGSVGSAAVQLSKYFGAKVTGVCSTTNLEMVQLIGADNAIDYTKEDFTKMGELYDIIFDTGNISFSHCKNSLKQNGIFLETGIGLAIFSTVLWTSIFGNKKAKIMSTGLRPPSERSKDLAFLARLMEVGKIKPVIDRIYPIEKIADAHRYVDQGHKKGNVVITVNTF